MFKKISHYFIPHPQTHQKAKLLSWQFLVIYILIFILVRVGLDLVSIYKPGVLGIDVSMSVEKIIADTNIERRKAGLQPVAYNSELSEAAKAKAQNMFAENYWSHFSPTGKDPWGFMKSAGYKFSYAGENLARNFSNPDDMVKAWMNSPTHRENLLNSKYQDIGVAVEEGVLQGQKTTLVVQMFGHPYEAVAAKPQIDTADQQLAFAQETTLLGKNVSVAGAQEKTPNALISPTTIIKTAGISLFALIAILLMTDFIVLRRRGVFRITGAHVAHLSFLGLAGISTLLAKAGEII